MPRKTKKTLTMKADDSLTGCVICCPLCSYRVYASTSREAWKVLYRHLRDHHGCEHAARLAEDARKRIYRS